MSNTNQIRLQYVAEDEGSRLAIFRTIGTGSYGRISKISRLHDKGVVYVIVIFTRDTDCEELLKDLKAAGIFIIAYSVNDKPVFLHKNRKEWRTKRLSRTRK